MFNNKRDRVNFVFVCVGILILVYCFSQKQKLKKVFLKNPLVKHVIEERRHALFKAKGVTLSFAAPASFKFLSQAVENMDFQNSGNFSEYISYYEKVIEYNPYVPEVYAMLAFCYYGAGHKDQSLEHYLKAYKLDPKYFWNNYNLGILYYQRGNHALASKFFSQAVSSDFDYSIRITFSEKVYQVIWRHIDDPKERIVGGLKEGHARAFHLLGLTLKSLGKDEEALKAIKMSAITRNAKDYSFLKEEKANLIAF